MIHLHIHRYESTEHGTLSRVTIDETVLYGIEQPWRDNRPFYSCIPAGEYLLEPHTSPRFGPVWAFVGGSVSHTCSNHLPRYSCLIHIANYAREVKGCLAVGMERRKGPQGEPKVYPSTPAVERLRELMPPDQVHRATITWF